MAIAYRPVVTYTYSQREKIKEKDKKITRGNIPHRRRELAEKEAEIFIKGLLDYEKWLEKNQNRPSNLKILDTKVEEFEIEGEIKISGKVRCGGEYEDAFIHVGKEDVNRILEGYRTRKVEVLIRVIE